MLPFAPAGTSGCLGQGYERAANDLPGAVNLHDKQREHCCLLGSGPQRLKSLNPQCLLL
jgi:hypothetical protein